MDTYGARPEIENAERRTPNVALASLKPIVTEPMSALIANDVLIALLIPAGV